MPPVLIPSFSGSFHYTETQVRRRTDRVAQLRAGIRCKEFHDSLPTTRRIFTVKQMAPYVNGDTVPLSNMQTRK